jgi:hypothetical protein
MSILSGTKIAEKRWAAETVGEMPPTVNPAPVDLLPPSEGKWSAEEGERNEEGMETDPPHSEMKE